MSPPAPAGLRYRGRVWPDGGPRTRDGGHRGRPAGELRRRNAAGGSRGAALTHLRAPARVRGGEPPARTQASFAESQQRYGRHDRTARRRGFEGDAQRPLARAPLYAQGVGWL